ncbi:CPK2 [Symbiodinium sp. CCMP2456]|nr:CPK2 [Symbiodinium sp. CCMP2456]
MGPLRKGLLGQPQDLLQQGLWAQFSCVRSPFCSKPATMKGAMAIYLAVAPLALLVVHGSQVTPVQKVVTLMEEMVEKGKSEIENEKTQFAEYVKFCEDTTSAKKTAIEEADARIESLTASIDKASSDVDQLTTEIVELDNIIASTSAEKANATTIRQKEAADYSATLTDYVDSITAMGKALTALKEQPKTRAQTTSLVQLSDLYQTRKLSPSEASKYLDSFLTGHTAGKTESLLSEAEAQPAAGYEFQSNGVIEMLEKLEVQFKEEKNSLKMEEQKKKTAFQNLVTGLDSENTDATKSKQSKLKEKASISEQKAKDESELADTTSTRKEDAKYKKDLELSWEERAAEFKSRQKLRGEELEALGKAIDIISGDAVTGSAGKHLPGLLQSGTAMAVVSVNRSLRTPNFRKVADFLQEKAAALHSQELAALAMRLQADPIDKVKEMIENMITRMEKDAASEATKKAWCQEELSENEEARGAKNDEIEALEADEAKLKSSLQQLAADLQALSQQVKDMNAAMTEATSIRQKEKEENTVAIKDAKAAQAAVAEALSVLNEFYAKAGQATALVQVQTRAGPQPFEKPYTGMGSESGGVLGMIEVIQSDFARLEAETTAAEQSAAKEYESFMDDSKLDLASKEKDISHKSSRKDSETQALTSVETDLVNVKKELSAVMKTYEELKPQCADESASYEERKAKRDAEIKSLEEALEALNIAR